MNIWKLLTSKNFKTLASSWGIILFIGSSLVGAGTFVARIDLGKEISACSFEKNMLNGKVQAKENEIYDREREIEFLEKRIKALEYDLFLLKDLHNYKLNSLRRDKQKNNF